uniref:Uncharacterized protein n=1 Tax=Avena sativa TaxID=4498 RepID=A0ACD5X6W1_AVESA
MEVIRGPVLPRCNAPALTSDARIGSQLLGRVRTRRRACGGVLQGDNYGVSPRLFGVPAQQHSRSGWLVCCSYGSSSDGDGTAAANFDPSGEEFVDSSVMEAVELRSVSDGFVIKLRDGRNLTCVQNNPRPRPTIYNVVKEMTEMMGYMVRLVRITEMVHDAYHSRLYLSKNGNEEETISFDLKPSDAINIAFRCKVPIQVNKSIAYSNGLKIVQPKPTGSYVNSEQIQYTRLDKPGDQPCFEAQEFYLVRSMLIAAVEERYKDAAQYRDQLLMFRAKKKNRI